MLSTMHNMSVGDMGDKFGHMFAYALYGIICVIAAIFVWKLVPETKGKTLEDMTDLWKKTIFLLPVVKSRGRY